MSAVACKAGVFVGKSCVAAACDSVCNSIALEGLFVVAVCPL